MPGNASHSATLTAYNYFKLTPREADYFIEETGGKSKKGAEMRIASSEVNLSSSHSLVESEEKSVEMRAWVDGAGGRSPSRAAGGPPAGQGPARDRVTLSGRPHPPIVKHPQPEHKKAEGVEGENEDDDGLDYKLRMMKTIVEALTGVKIKVFNPAAHGGDGNEGAGPDAPPPQGRAEGQQRAGWGFSYDSREVHSESEVMNFSAEGVIKTQDGQEIKFAARLEMSRSYYSEETVSIRAGDARLKDPLVVNFGGSAAELTSTRFAFDLDSDGTNENMPFVGSGSGLLVLDLNNDGIVNNGSELFGPNTGNGMAELAAYDSDGNNWIDENDPVYERLSVWTKDENQADRLSSLKEKNVGAIYLGSVESPFNIKDGNNELLGQVARTGVYLEEDGTAKTIQQVNLTV